MKNLTTNRYAQYLEIEIQLLRNFYTKQLEQGKHIRELRKERVRLNTLQNQLKLHRNI